MPPLNGFSDDGGLSWSAAQPVPAPTGPTCQGGVALPDGRVLVSAPHWPHWRYPADRKNMSVMAFDVGAPNASARAPADPVRRAARVAGPAAYSAIAEGADTILFEGGDTYRYASILFARLDAW